MSFIKRRLEHIQRYHYDCDIDKMVCPNCIGDKYLKKYIRIHAQHNECSYCGRKSKKDISISLNDFMELVMDGVLSEYAEAVEWLPYDKGYEGNYSDSDELVDAVIAPEIDTDNDDLIEDIKQCVESTDWCEDDPFGEKISEIDKRVWTVFSEQVKHSTRYMFYKVFSNNIGSDNYDYEQPYDVLGNIGKYTRQLHLVKRFERIAFYRARKFDKGQKKPFNTVGDLAAPKTEDAKFSNRMSPAGIPMFYGALEEETVLIEISGDKKRRATVVRFIPSKPLYLLDLRSIKVPSLFDPVNRAYRQAAYFLNEFVRSITQPVDLSDTERIDYVPSQVVTEYFRHVFRLKGRRIDGLLYKSSRCEGTCCCLFIENHECTDDANDEDKRLYMDKASIKVRTLTPYVPIKDGGLFARTIL